MPIISIRIPDNYLEMIDAISNDRSAFIRNAIAEKLGIEPSEESYDKIRELEERVARLEVLLSGGRSCINEQEEIREKIAIREICADEIDRKILTQLMESPKTTTELEKKDIGLKRRRILDRIKEINERCRKKYNREILVFRRKGANQVWSLNEKVQLE